DPLIGRTEDEGAHREGAKDDVDQEEDADRPPIGDEGELNRRLVDGIRTGEAASAEHRRSVRLENAPAEATGQAGRADEKAETTEQGFPRQQVGLAAERPQQ